MLLKVILIVTSVHPLGLNGLGLAWIGRASLDEGSETVPALLRTTKTSAPTASILGHCSVHSLSLFSCELICGCTGDDTMCEADHRNGMLKMLRSNLYIFRRSTQTPQPCFRCSPFTCQRSSSRTSPLPTPEPFQCSSWGAMLLLGDMDSPTNLPVIIIKDDEAFITTAKSYLIAAIVPPV